MKLIYASILALGFLIAPGFAGDFSGSFGRAHLPACNTVNGNWIGAYDSCPPLGSGSGIVLDGDPVFVDHKPPCPPKETETPA